MEGAGLRSELPALDEVNGVKKLYLKCRKVREN
jgi:hypothetical protein